MSDDGPRGDAPVRPSEDAIRIRAHEISQRPGAGSPEDCWLQAERELLAELEHADALEQARVEEAEGLRAAHWFTQSHP